MHNREFVLARKDGPAFALGILCQAEMSFFYLVALDHTKQLNNVILGKTWPYFRVGVGHTRKTNRVRVWGYMVSVTLGIAINHMCNQSISHTYVMSPNKNWTPRLWWASLVGDTSCLWFHIRPVKSSFLVPQGEDKDVLHLVLPQSPPCASPFGSSL